MENEQEQTTYNFENQPQKNFSSRKTILTLFILVLLVAVYLVLTITNKESNQDSANSSLDRRFPIDSVENVFLRFDSETGEIVDVLDGVSLEKARKKISKAKRSEWVRGDGVMRKEEKCNDVGLCVNFTFDLHEDSTGIHVLIYEKENNFITFNKIGFGTTMGEGQDRTELGEIVWRYTGWEKSASFIERWSEESAETIVYRRRVFSVDLVNIGKMQRQTNETYSFLDKITIQETQIPHLRGDIIISDNPDKDDFWSERDPVEFADVLVDSYVVDSKIGDFLSIQGKKLAKTGSVYDRLRLAFVALPESYSVGNYVVIPLRYELNSVVPSIWQKNTDGSLTFQRFAEGHYYGDGLITLAIDEASGTWNFTASWASGGEGGRSTDVYHLNSENWKFDLVSSEYEAFPPLVDN